MLAIFLMKNAYISLASCCLSLRVPLNRSACNNVWACVVRSLITNIGNEITIIVLTSSLYKKDRIVFSFSVLLLNRMTCYVWLIHTSFKNAFPAEAHTALERAAPRYAGLVTSDNLLSRSAVIKSNAHVLDRIKGRCFFDNLSHC